MADIILKTALHKQKMNSSSLGLSRHQLNKKPPSKLSLYETNLENYIKYTQTTKFGGQKIDPKGLPVTGIYASFSGVIESLEVMIVQMKLFTDEDTDMMIEYEIKFGKEWHDETPEDTKGCSNFCSSKNGKITFSLGFDTLVSCMYIESWPQLLIKIRGFDMYGHQIAKGYAQIFLPTEPGMQVKEAAVYQIVRNVKWYHKWLPFLEPAYISYDPKEFERIIEKGQGRETQKIKCIGKMKIRTEVLLRNFNRFGYQ